MSRFASSLRIVLSGLLCLTALTNASSQKPVNPADQQDVIRIDTELVETAVTVIDRQGRFVEGLKPEQFELRIQGKSVPISFFEQAGRVDTSANEVEGSRVIAFFVDDLHLSPESIEPVRAFLSRFVENEKLSGDRVAIVSASGQIGFLQQLTDHQAVLRAALARLKQRPKTIQDSGGTAMTEYAAYRISQGDRSILTFHTNELLRSLQFTYALPKYGGKGAGYLAGSESDQAERMVIRRAESIITQSIGNSIVALGSLEQFLRSLAHVSDRKAVFYLSDGLLMHGRNGEIARAMQHVNEAAAIANAAIYHVDTRALTGSLQASQMKVDLVGRSDPYGAGESEAMQTGLAGLAVETGGRSITDAQKLSSEVKAAVVESGRHYLIAWRPENEAQKSANFSGLTINISSRPELKTRLSAGYPTKLVKNTNRQNSQPIYRKSDELPTRLLTSFLNTPTNGNVLTASTQITIDQETLGKASGSTAVDLAGVILDDQGKVANSFQKQLVVQPLSPGPLSTDTSVIYNHRAPIKPGLYQVRIAARHTASGRLGRTTQWIEVPNLSDGRLLLSSLLLEGTTSDSKTVAESPAFQRSVDRRFTRNTRMSFVAFIYNATSTGDVKAEVKVTRRGQPVLTIPRFRVPIDKGSDMLRIPLTGSFPLTGLPPGKYLLQVTVNDGGSRQVSQQIDFEVI